MKRKAYGSIGFMDIAVRSVDYKNGNFLMRGPRPANEDAIKELKCHTVIDLESGWFEFLHGRAGEEDRWVKDTDILVRHLPLSDICPPIEYQVRAFLAMVTVGLQRGSVYFHCLHGVDRTGYMAAMYRIRVQGWSPQAAVDEMLKLGFHKLPYYFWIRSLLNG